MALPLVAIVGRPNVGKSTLFNRIIGERRAIVEDLPGTTRDRILGETEWNGVRFAVMDTGGLMSEAEIERSTSAELSEATQRQAMLALEQADVIVFVVDGGVGLTAGDYEVADLIRRSKKPAVLAVNKAESQVRADNAVEFYALGLGDPLAISSLHGRGVGDLLDEVVRDLAPHVEEVEDEEDVAHIAIVGRPNVGKSALLNTLLGENRQIVSTVPGTTRDAIDTELTWRGVPLVLIDTAGIRRRGKVERGIEKYSVVRSMRAIDRCDVCVLVLDATEPFTAQDQHVTSYVLEEKKGLVLVVNKWDLIEKNDKTMNEFVAEARRQFEFVPYAPIVFTSALTGQRVEKVMETVLLVMAERAKRVPTAELNKVIREAVANHPPPSKPGKWVKFYYATQAATEPPTFVIFCNDPQNVHFSYQRYLENTLREHFGFTGTPLVIRLRARNRQAA